MNSQANSITNEKSCGRVYTPLFIVNNVLDLSEYYEDNIIKKHAIDNSCGDGAFLCEMVRRYCEISLKIGKTKKEISNELAEYIHGIEIDETECNKCIKNVSKVAEKFGIKNVNWDIHCGDALQIHDYDNKMDFVVGNPPYVRVHNLGDSFDDIKRFSFSQGGMTDLFIVFYEVGLNMLSSTGILGYITPSSFFNSLAGSYMRKVFVDEQLMRKVVDLKHFQAFNATTYTTIVILSKYKKNNQIEYYQFDEKNLIPYYVSTLTANDYYISGNFYFSTVEDLNILKKIFYNLGRCDASVKNGYATLCDNVFIGQFPFSSKYIIPVIKSSKGIEQQIIFPYDKNAKLIEEEKLENESELYEYLVSRKDLLLKRSNERDNYQYWYAFGRSQAISDTFKNKLAINTLIRNQDDLKFVDAPIGVGVYGGLYIISDTIPVSDIKKTLRSQEFARYVSLLGKYKSGGYYTFSSKDVKSYLDYKFSYFGGICQC